MNGLILKTFIGYCPGVLNPRLAHGPKALPTMRQKYVDVDAIVFARAPACPVCSCVTNVALPKPCPAARPAKAAWKIGSAVCPGNPLFAKPVLPFARLMARLFCAARN